MESMMDLLKLNIKSCKPRREFVVNEYFKPIKKLSKWSELKVFIWFKSTKKDQGAGQGVWKSFTFWTTLTNNISNGVKNVYFNEIFTIIMLNPLKLIIEYYGKMPKRETFLEMSHSINIQGDENSSISFHIKIKFRFERKNKIGIHYN